MLLSAYMPTMMVPAALIPKAWVLRAPGKSERVTAPRHKKSVVRAAGVPVPAHDDGASRIDPQGSSAPLGDREGGEAAPLPHKAVLRAAAVRVHAHDDGASRIDPQGSGTPRARDVEGGEAAPLPHKAVVRAAGVLVSAHDDGAGRIDPEGSGAPRARDVEGGEAAPCHRKPWVVPLVSSYKPTTLVPAALIPKASVSTAPGTSRG